MKKLNRNIQILISFLLIISAVLAFGLYYQMVQSQTTFLAVAGENKASLAKLYSQAGTIYSRDDVALATSETGQREYVEDLNLQKSISHLVGDYTHHMANTIETQYQNDLLGRNRNVLDQLFLDISANGLVGDDVHLTIHSELNKYAYELMSNYNAAAVVLDYTTGEILAISSTPAASMEDVINYDNLPDTSLFNRALNGAYIPGSTWKIMTAAAWVNSNNYNPNLVINSDGTALRPNGANDIPAKGMNGDYDLNRAFTTSSNVFFGELAVLIGQSNLQSYIESTGLGTLNELNRLAVTRSKVDSSAAANDDALLSWFGIGQPAGDLILTISPLEMASLTGAIANGGRQMEPFVVNNLTNPLGQDRQVVNPSVRDQAFDVGTANRLKALMIEAIESPESIQYTVGIDGFTVGGKTGTGETEGQGDTAVWTGFIDDPAYPYAVAVVVESSPSTNETAARIGNSLLSRAIGLKYRG